MGIFNGQPTIRRQWIFGVVGVDAMQLKMEPIQKSYNFSQGMIPGLELNLTSSLSARGMTGITEERIAGGSLCTKFGLCENEVLFNPQKKPEVKATKMVELSEDE